MLRLESSSRRRAASRRNTSTALAGVQHHVALSVVGTDRLQASGYFRAKLVQEKLIEAATAMGHFVQRYLIAIGDPRTVVADATALYFGVAVNDPSLTPGSSPRIRGAEPGGLAGAARSRNSETLVACP